MDDDLGVPPWFRKAPCGKSSATADHFPWFNETLWPTPLVFSNELHGLTLWVFSGNPYAKNLRRWEKGFTIGLLVKNQQKKTSIKGGVLSHGGMSRSWMTTIRFSETHGWQVGKKRKKKSNWLLIRFSQFAVHPYKPFIHFQVYPSVLDGLWLYEPFWVTSSFVMGYTV